MFWKKGWRMRKSMIIMFGIFLIFKFFVDAQETSVDQSQDLLFYQLFNIATSDGVVKEILKTKPQYVNMRNKDGMTPLIFAAKNSNISRVNLLLSYNANPNVQSRDSILHTDMPIDKGGNTALHYALFFGYTPSVFDIVTSLINHGADMGIRNTMRDLPIHYLREIQNIADRTKVFQYMIDHGADVNARGFKGNTIVHQVVEKNDYPWLAVLKTQFKPLVNFNIKNDEGQTPTDLAVKYLNTGMVAALHGL